MGILWKHLWARIKSRLSYDDFVAIFRFYADATARNEPIASYVGRIAESDSTADPIDAVVECISDRLRLIAVEKTKEAQARECRILILEKADIAIEDHYLTIGADQSLRHICLAAVHDAETDEDVQKKYYETLWSYFEAFWIETSLACLYEEQFGSYMSLDAFSKQYRAMTELYIRFLCNTLFSAVMSEHDREDLRKISELYQEACSNSTVLELSEIRRKYREAIRSGIVEDLYPQQERFAEVGKAAQYRIGVGLDGGIA